MKLLLDMNLSPQLVSQLQQKGYTCCHWSQIGQITAEDQVIFDWAAEQGYIVITNDLDFGAILAATGNALPSVIQIRCRNVSTKRVLPLLQQILSDFAQPLTEGALIILDESKCRVRLLPLR